MSEANSSVQLRAWGNRFTNSYCIVWYNLHIFILWLPTNIYDKAAFATVDQLADVSKTFKLILEMCKYQKLMF